MSVIASSGLGRASDEAPSGRAGSSRDRCRWQASP